MTCDQHSRADCPDVAIVRYGMGDDVSFGIPIRDGGSSFYAIRRCPWCGAVL